jgi:secretion/DNA translocation related TadE-like protein
VRSLGVREERGGIVGLLPAYVMIGALLLGGLARLGGAVVGQARADAAADAAALAAADALAQLHGPVAAVRAARTVAADNGARLVRCDCRGTAAEVVVVVRPPIALGPLASSVRGIARAEVEGAAAIGP